MPHIILTDGYFQLEKIDWNVLRSIEIGLKNREYVSGKEVACIAKCSHRELMSSIKNNLIDLRLVAYEGEGYRLSILGFDYLALKSYHDIGFLKDFSMFSLIGTGKESDVYISNSGHRISEEPLPMVLKFHRLGRTSFKQVRNKRNYKRGNKCSWFEMNRTSANLEFSIMKTLYNFEFPVPKAYGKNRGCVCMEYIAGSVPLFKFNKAVLDNGAAHVLYNQAKNILIKLAQHGVVHGDLNEFNFLVKTNSDICIETIDQSENDYSDKISDDFDDENSDNTDDENSENEECDNNSVLLNDEQNEFDIEEICPYLNDDINTFKLIMIDFPQAISRDDQMGEEIYSRDRDGIINFFRKFFVISENDLPPKTLSEIDRKAFLDVYLRFPGSMTKQQARKEGYKEEDYELEEIIQEEKEVTLKKNKPKEKQKINYSKQVRNKRKKEDRLDMKSDFF